MNDEVLMFIVGAIYTSTVPYLTLTVHLKLEKGYQSGVTCKAFLQT